MNMHNFAAKVEGRFHKTGNPAAKVAYAGSGWFTVNDGAAVATLVRADLEDKISKFERAKAKGAGRWDTF